VRKTVTKQDIWGDKERGNKYKIEVECNVVEKERKERRNIKRNVRRRREMRNTHTHTHTKREREQERK
jgi:hypothetical protein